MVENCLGELFHCTLQSWSYVLITSYRRNLQSPKTGARIKSRRDLLSPGVAVLIKSCDRENKRLPAVEEGMRRIITSMSEVAAYKLLQIEDGACLGSNEIEGWANCSGEIRRSGLTKLDESITLLVSTHASFCPHVHSSFVNTVTGH